LLYKNGGTVLPEWFEHYAQEGADQFFLIDDGSTDGYVPPTAVHERTVIHFTVAALAERAANLGMDQSTLTSAAEGSLNQREIYMVATELLKETTEWILIVDVDEFVSTRRRPRSTLARELATTFDSADMVMIPWAFMGFKDQEHDYLSVRKSLIWRLDYDNLKSKQWGNNADEKLIVSHRYIRTKHAFRVGSKCDCRHCAEGFRRACCIHQSGCRPNATVTSAVSAVPNDDKLIYPRTPRELFRHNGINERDIESAYLLCYHYRFKSKDDVRSKCTSASRFKMYSGSNCTQHVLGTAEMFAEVMDTSLLQKVLQRSKQPVRKVRYLDGPRTVLWEDTG
jgi:hypothetical protein